MIAHVQEWLELAARWFHVVVGAAWIGTSFYFNWLNNNVREMETPEDGVKGDLWSVHGGAFYRVVKYQVAPAQLPKTLHWFKYEAYFTWISGVCLLFLVYYLGADGFLIDNEVAEISKGTAVGIGVGALVGGWIFYDLLCKSPLRQRPLVLGGLGFTVACAAAYGLCQVLSARAAYIHIGAILGTCMAGNVFFVIIPGQRKMVDAMIRGDEPDPEPGRAGSLRSLHNNYLTLPVLFIMVSSHYPMTYGHGWNWAILAGIALVGALVRHWFNLHGLGRMNQWLLPAAALGFLGLAFVTRPVAVTDTGPAVSFSKEIHPIIHLRCTPCHAEAPTFEGIVGPQGGVLLETPAQIKGQAASINKNAVQSKYMPLGNLTQITPEERALLGRWIQAGAAID